MFKGSNVALITPFKNNELDVEAYIKLIHFQISNGTNGLVPAGTTGESPTLPGATAGTYYPISEHPFHLALYNMPFC